MNYHPWTEIEHDDAFVWLNKVPKEIEAKDYLLDKGIPASSWFPTEVVFDFEPNGGIKPGDAVRNALGFHIHERAHQA